MQNDEALVAEVNALMPEFQQFIQREKAAWLSKNRMGPRNNVYEAMTESERSEVHYRMKSLANHLEKLSDDWWSERGFKVLWPDDDRKPMSFERLETA